MNAGRKMLTAGALATLCAACVPVDEGRIVALLPGRQAPAGAKVIDLGSRFVLPGVPFEEHTPPAQIAPRQALRLAGA